MTKVNYVGRMYLDGEDREISIGFDEDSVVLNLCDGSALIRFDRHQLKLFLAMIAAAQSALPENCTVEK